ncbi:MAG: hypothetical protein GWP11_02535 [Proteobacteria bacterium]|nr:hypothetical protein [Pseudomonadota bacterium]
MFKRLLVSGKGGLDEADRKTGVLLRSDRGPDTTSLCVLNKSRGGAAVFAGTGEFHFLS